jgi:Holliday junction resolvase RusA-like endonuclease
MTRADAWKKRKCVLDYWAYKDNLRLLGVQIPEHHHIIFCMQPPKSWPEKRKLASYGKPMQGKPDIDNLLKAVYDCVLDEDKHVWDVRATKVWAKQDAILVIEIPPPSIPLDQGFF